MPWIAKRLARRFKPGPSPIRLGVSALTEMRNEAEKQADYVRDLLFDDWIRRSVVDAAMPAEWTKARALYDNYLAHARVVGPMLEAERLLMLEAATETAWGRMMSSLFQKKRRGTGWHYPLKCRSRPKPESIAKGKRGSNP